jgi:FixJ family two-component response regulator
MTPSAPTVFVVDDDALVRASIAGMLKSVGLRAQTFETPQEFLRSKRPDVPSCLVLDVRLPGVNGLDFQRQLGSPTRTQHLRIQSRGSGSEAASATHVKERV